MKKVLVLLLTITTLISCMTIYSSAEDYEIQPYYENIVRASTNFSITSSGLACVSATYYGYPDIMTEIKCEIYLQKRFLGLFWTTVDIGVPDNVWVDYSTSTNGNFYHEFQLSDTGTYKAVFKLTFFGNTYVQDVVEDEIEDKY